MKHYILVNPVSGNKKGIKHGISIKKLLKKYGIDATMVVSKYSGHLTEVAKDLSSKHTCRFYSVGGDGTLNEIISGMYGSDSDIVVIPCGTGNDFIKSISKYMSMRKIIAFSINASSTPTDILRLNDNKYCINILNAGFDAMVAKNVDHFRNVPFVSGKLKYNLAIFYTLLMNKNYKFKLRTYCNIKDKMTPVNSLKQNFTLIAICNGKYYGGGIPPCPKANVLDGIIDICAVDSTRIRQKIIFLPKYTKGNHINLSKAHFYKAQKVHIVSNNEFPVSNDGEVFYTKKLSIDVLKGAINIVHIK